MSEAVIQVQGLTTRFGATVVHRGLDLEVRRGEILGVVGGSGTGKSVLLRACIGLVRPVAGEVRLFGERLDGPAGDALRRRFGVLFQNGALFSSLTVAENVAFPLVEHLGLPRPEALELARARLALAGFPLEAAERYPKALSGGMVKRAALARALALEPELLFLDEPTAGLDPITAGAFDRLVVTLRDALGLTVFLVTHDLDTLYAACDRVAVLARGRVLVADTLARVRDTDDPWIREYFHGPRGRAAAAAQR
ncbi:MAG: ABC transporter ATP-binding protein [Porticoccaceae bacterium]|nr:MAG: ABC transporter ATP-binding protein [Porticoccaceae bacterium]